MNEITVGEGFEEAQRRIAEAARKRSSSLALNNLELTEVPESFGQLAALRALELSGNRLTSIPEALGKLTELQELYLSDNLLTSVPESISQLSQLQRLSLSGNQVTSIPDSISQLQQLWQLVLHNNRLTSVPDSFGRLAQLHELYLNSNQLTSVPESFGNLSQLSRLNLCDNALSELPDTLSNLPQLTGFWLRKNSLSRVPDSFSQLNALRYFSLSENPLLRVPEWLGQLAQLRNLWLDSVRVSNIPESFGRLIHLEVLSLIDNQLTTIPRSFRKLKSLRFLYLHDNPALNLPESLLGSDPRRAGVRLAKTNKPALILDYYFRTRSTHQRRSLAEAKLILVGRGEVGKTSLVRRLIENKFSRHEDRTPGIQIKPLVVKAKRSTAVRLHVWDFGGQEIMHATHQFFLTDRSIYLLVLDGRAGQQEVEADYWLRLIGSFAPESPVLVVLNKCKTDPFDLNRRALQDKYPQVKGYFETDCHNSGKNQKQGADGFGIETLRKGIIREVNRLKEVWTAFPASWVKIKEELPKLKREYVSFEDYRKFCAENGESDSVAQDNLAGHLHRLGIALNFREDNRLRDQHVLNPHWITEGIYTLLNSDRLGKKGGELTLRDLPKELDAKRYPKEMHRFLLHLMEKFELCFSDPKEDRYLIPELLAQQQPKAADSFHRNENLAFQYHYPVIPPGLLPRFIVRTHVLSKKHRWRSGVILNFEGNEALVKADPSDKKVFISVTGPVEGRRRMLAVIREDFDAIHREIVRLNPQEMVPLPEHPDAEPVPYLDLEVLEQNDPQATLKRVIDRKVVTLSVRELLNGVDLSVPSVVGTSGRTIRPGRTGAENPNAVRVFFSYSHADAGHRNKLDKHLAPLRRTGLIRNWYDRELLPGTQFDNEVADHLKDSEIVLLLVSPDFIDSDYCCEIETKQAAKQYRSGTTAIIPVIIRPTADDWKDVALDDELVLGDLIALPDALKAVTKWKPQDDGWAEVAAGIGRVAKEILKKRRGGLDRGELDGGI